MRIKQLIRGNPGDCYIACLLYVLSCRYDITTDAVTQKDIYIKGILSSKLTFYMGSINEIAGRYKLPLNIYISNRQQTLSAKKEVRGDKVIVNYGDLDMNLANRLLDQHKYLTLSVDRYVLYPFYHDYFFVSVIKKDITYEIFDPYSGKTREINKENLYEYVYSTRVNLDDVAIAIVV